MSENNYLLKSCSSNIFASIKNIKTGVNNILFNDRIKESEFNSRVDSVCSISENLRNIDIAIRRFPYVGKHRYSSYKKILSEMEEFRTYLEELEKDAETKARLEKNNNYDIYFHIITTVDTFIVRLREKH